MLRLHMYQWKIVSYRKTEKRINYADTRDYFEEYYTIVVSSCLICGKLKQQRVEGSHDFQIE